MATSTIVKTLRANTGARDLHTVVEDFCAMAAAAIRNRVDPHGHQDREEDYERTRTHYTPAQMDRTRFRLSRPQVPCSRSCRCGIP